MITKFITEVSIQFNAFKKSGKTCRIFLASLPADVRRTVKITTRPLPRESDQPSHLHLKFKDGKEMNLDTEKIGIKDIMEEVDRHSRVLKRKADLGGA